MKVQVQLPWLLYLSTQLGNSTSCMPVSALLLALCQPACCAAARRVGMQYAVNQWQMVALQKKAAFTKLHE